MKASCAIFRTVAPDCTSEHLGEWLKKCFAEHSAHLVAHNAHGTLDYLQMVALCFERCEIGWALDGLARFAVAVCVVMFGVKHPGQPPPVHSDPP